MKKVSAAAAGVLLALFATLVWRAATLRSKQLRVDAVAPSGADPAPLADRLAAAVRLRTVSHQEPGPADAAQFDGFVRYLERAFPSVHASLTREVIGGYSSLFTWAGSDGGVAEPVLLMAHMDTVPVEAESEAAWTHPPFGGEIADGFVWGRGTLDDKVGVLGVLEAVERLLGEGFRPKRTVLLAFGQDEEVGGTTGAQAVAARLAERKVRLDFVLDEGGAIVSGFLPGLESPVATVGIAEKGYVSVELSVETAGGHSSIPPATTAIGVLSAAIQRLDATRCPRASTPCALARLLGSECRSRSGSCSPTCGCSGRSSSASCRRSPATNAASARRPLRRCFAAGVKDNVLPATARAVVNFRILPGETVETVVEHVRRTIDDPTITVKILGEGDNPSPLSDPDAPAFTRVARAIRATFPGIVVSPFLSLGATDARYYTIVSQNVYRFAPYRLRAEDLARIHGTNERISINDYVGMIRFYVALLGSQRPLGNGRAGVDRAGRGGAASGNGQ